MSKIIVPRHEPTCPEISKWVCVQNYEYEYDGSYLCYQKNYRVMEPIEDEL